MSIEKGDKSMAYVNERVPKEEARGYMIPNYKEIVPFSWTIDREKDIKLFKYWANMDDPSEIYFALVWKGMVIKVVLRKEVVENTVIWHLKALNIPEEYSLEKEKVLVELRQALKEYGLSGYMIIKRTISTETLCNF